MLSNLQKPSAVAVLALVIGGVIISWAFIWGSTEHVPIWHLSHSVGANATARVVLNVASRRPIPKELFGISFEEVNHAGEGGLYAELVNDRSFDALAYMKGFLEGAVTEVLVYSSKVPAHTAMSRALNPAHSVRRLASEELGAESLAATSALTEMDQDVASAEHARILKPQARPEGRQFAGNHGTQAGLQASVRPLLQRLAIRAKGVQQIPVSDASSWSVFGGAQLSLRRDSPLNPSNAIYGHVSGPEGAALGIVNDGYKGIPVLPGRSYYCTVFVRCTQDPVIDLEVSLRSADRRAIYSQALLSESCSNKWQQLSVTLPRARVATLEKGVLVLTFKGPGPLDIDMLSLVPYENVELGAQPGQGVAWVGPKSPRVSPFTPHLMNALRGLKPAFLRFPGGAYSQGVSLTDGFNWKETVAAPESRPGHANKNWGYWSTDGLGFYEYLLLAELLGALPVWTINSGISASNDQIGNLAQMAEEVLDGLEFIHASANESKWGKMRADLGHPAPWPLPTLVVGHQGCAKPQYASHLREITTRVKRRFPEVQIVASCDLSGDGGKADMWEWQSYRDPKGTWDVRHALAHYAGRPVIVSEYAAVSPTDSLEAALSEAGLLLAVLRNPGSSVRGVSYSPLMAHAQYTLLRPALLTFNATTLSLSPSYHVASLLSHHFSGKDYIATEVMVSPQQMQSSNEDDKDERRREEGHELAEGDDSRRRVLSGEGSRNKMGWTLRSLLGMGPEDRGGRDLGPDVLEAAAACSLPVDSTSSPCEEISFVLVNFSPAPETASVNVLGLPRSRQLKPRGRGLILSGAPHAENNLLYPDAVSPHELVMEDVGVHMKVHLPGWSLIILTLETEAAPSS